MDQPFIYRNVRLPQEVDRALARAKQERPHMTITALIVEAVSEKFMKPDDASGR